MGWGEVASGELQSKALETHRSRVTDKDGKPIFQDAPCATPERLVTKRAIVLDMGEASREQGFRLNGCR